MWESRPEPQEPSETPAESFAWQRILAGLVAIPLSLFSLPLVGALLSGRIDPLGAILGSFIATLAILCWWFALRGHVAESRRRMKLAVQGGLILGGLGFVAGFVGPILLNPGANQGPLLGIFITGPLGFIVGSAAGWLYARFQTGDTGNSASHRRAA